MTSVQIVKQKKCKQKGKAGRKPCCFSCFRAKASDSDTSVEADFNEPYEYIVEKLVIKRVPVKRLSTTSELKHAKSISSGKEVKPIVTFSSYCQMKPMVVNSGVKTKKKSASLMDELSDGDKSNVLVSEKKAEEKRDKKEEAVLNEICADGDKRLIGFDSPREEMTSGRREQLQQCAKNLNTAQVYKHTANSPRNAAAPKTDNTVLFTKPPPVRDKRKKDLPPAVKETMDLLASKQPLSNVNRRLVTRDPDTGQIKEIFQNVKIEKPVRLDEIYNQKNDANSDKKLPKWKIIIRHQEDKLKQKFEESSSDLGIDSDVYSNKNII